MNATLTYQEKAKSEIRRAVEAFECQPILFVGSGISRRYFDAPNWIELLKIAYSKITTPKQKFEYYVQKHNGNAIEIGNDIAGIIFEWAWSDGRSSFPDNYFTESIKMDQFLKYVVGQHLKEITPNIGNIPRIFADELNSLSSIKPHAIITTNYDTFIETIFSGYETIIGQTILKYNTNSFGEIFHIHGHVSDTNSIVLTKADFGEWDKKKKYISAKLLTYFAEHPVFIFGYSLNDPNIRSILKDIAEIVSTKDGLIDNVYQVIWHSDKVPEGPAEHSVVELDGFEFRIHAIHTNELKWVFDALESKSELKSVNVKLVRALAARAFRLIRQDIPAGSVKINYEILENIAGDEEELPKLLGITSVDNLNHSHPLTLTQVAEKIGYTYWKPADNLIKKIAKETGINIKDSDNKFHCQIKTGAGKNSLARKWSHLTVELLKLAQSGQEYKHLLEGVTI